MECVSSSTPNARKEHVCNSCMRKIALNEVYNRAFMTEGGDSWTWKSHLACQLAGNILFNAGLEGDEYDSLINVTDMDSELREIVFEKSPETYRAVWPNAPDPGHELILTDRTDPHHPNR